MKYHATKSLIGLTFGRLTVIEKLSNKGKERAWRCRCLCGRYVSVRTGTLSKGHTKSCGCLHGEMMIARNQSHGLSKTPEYKIWGGMKKRCRPEFKRYGGRGIAVCGRWLDSFENFYADMGPRPSDKHSIDRRDNNGNYEPSNCRWSTKSEQALNRRSNRLIEFRGQIRTLSQWSQITGLPEDAIRNRITLGWSTEKTLTAPLRPVHWKGRSRRTA